MLPEEFKELQDYEVEALRAIYMDDYEDLNSKSAWNVCDKFTRQRC